MNDGGANTGHPIFLSQTARICATVMLQTQMGRTKRFYQQIGRSRPFGGGHHAIALEAALRTSCY